MDLTYSHKIVSVDIEQGTLVVEYTPNDTDLIPIIYNIGFLEKPHNLTQYADQDSVPFLESMSYSIEAHAPVGLWRRQKLLITNIQSIL